MQISKFLLLIGLLILVLIQTAYSQTEKTVAINGTITESATKKPLQFASVSLLTLKDSTLVKGGISNNNGAFSFTNVTPGIYKLRLSFLGYTTIRKVITIQGSPSNQNLGNFALEEGKSLMNEVVITATLPVLVKKDTLEYNADMFKVEKNAVVEDMLKKLPGVEIDGDGKIKAQGADVSRVFVDGKQFFGNDPLIATQNLPAEMISKVQVIDKKSDQAEFSGIDDGEVEKIINIVTRQGYKHGTFGKTSAGYGSLDRYDAGLMLNNFQDDRQFSVIGMANNTNNLRFTLDAANSLNNRRGSTLSSARGSRMSGGGGGGGFSSMTSAGRGMTQSGISVTEAGGVNFHDKIGKKLEFTGSYFYNANNKNTSQISMTQTLKAADTSIYKRDTTSNFNTTENHRINMEFNYQIDSLNSILFRPNISYALTGSERASNSRTLGESGFRLNESNSTSNSDGSNWNTAANLMYRRKFKKKGRTFSLNLTGNLTSSNTATLSESYISKYVTPTGIPSLIHTDLLLNNTSDRNGFNARASYTEPITQSMSLDLNYFYSKSFNFSQREAFDKNELTKIYDRPDTAYSNRFDNSFVNQRLGVSIQTRLEKLIYTFGLGIESSEILSKTHVLDTLFDRTHKSVNFSPTASLNYSFTNRRRLSLQYHGSTNEPSIDQLQPIVSDPNSLTIRKGNPDLRSSFTNDLSMSYNDVDIKTFANYFVNIQFSNVLNSISNNYVNGPNGEQIITPVNVKGAYDASLNLGMGRPLANNKFSINTSGSLRWSNDVNFVRNTATALNNNTVLDTAASKLNTTRTLTAGYNLSGSINGKVVMFTLSGRINYNRAWQSVQTNNTNIYVSYNMLGDLKLILPWSIMIATDFQYNLNTGYGNGYNKNYALWNASMTKDMLKNKRLQAKFQIYDILKQNQSIRRSINGNNITDSQSTILPQYFICSLVYNFNNFRQPEGQRNGMRQRGPGGMGDRGAGGFGGGGREMRGGGGRGF